MKAIEILLMPTVDATMGKHYMDTRMFGFFIQLRIVMSLLVIENNSFFIHDDGSSAVQNCARSTDLSISLLSAVESTQNQLFPKK